MLQAIHGKAASWVAKILATLLIISFGAWGIADYIGPTGAPTEVAEVGSTKITSREFNDQFRSGMERLRSVFGATLDSEQARQLGLAETTVQDLVTRRLLRLEADGLGLLVGDDQIRTRIGQERAFRNLAGQFDQSIFQQTLLQNGTTEARYVASLRSRMARANLTDVIAAGSRAPGSLARALYRYRNEKRTAHLVLISRASSPRPKTPGEAELTDFHKKNASLFTAPELRDITAIHLDPVAFAKGIAPSKQQIRDEYENRLSALSVPERRQLRQMIIQDESAARQAAARLKGGATFDAVARKETGKSGKDLSLGLLTFNDLPAELAAVAFKLKAKETSVPVKTSFGWHILVVEKIHPGRTPALKEVREPISRALAREQAMDVLVKLANKLEDSLAGGASLEEAARGIGARVVVARGIDASGKDAKGIAVRSLPGDPRFLATAFETGDRETSNLIEAQGGGSFIVRVDRVVAPKLRPFASVRKQVAEAWRLHSRNAAARKTAKAILDQVRAGTPLGRVAAKRKLKVITTKPFTRFNREASSRLPQALAAKLFAVRKGGAELGPTENGFAVAEVRGIEAADPAKGKAQMDELGDQLSTAIAGDILAQFSSALRQQYPVSINRQAIDSLFNERGGRSQY